MVLPSRIELPTPSLPRTCSTTELRQRPMWVPSLVRTGSPENGADNAILGQPRQGPEKPGLFRRFHQFSIVWPSFDHGGSVTNAAGSEGPVPDSTLEDSHDDCDARLVAAVPEPAASSPGYPRVSPADGCPRRPACRALTRGNRDGRTEQLT